MRKFALVFFLLIPLLVYCENKPQVTFFYSLHCQKCLQLKREFLVTIKDKYKDKLEWKELDINADPNNLSSLIYIGARFGKKEALVPSILIGNIFLVGKSAIEKDLERAIKIALKEKINPFSFLKTDLVTTFKKLSVFTVIMAGLFDGINPCAFAVIVFFISFLAVYGYRKREIIYVGLAYCFSVFITYLLIGFGFFKFLYSMSNFYILIKLFYYFVAFFCFILAGFALLDYLKYKKTADPENLILQLPKFLKKRINVVIGSHLRDKRERGIVSLVVSSFLVGFLVSLLEAACTGQVYLPTIVYIVKNTKLRLKALTYLILYNLMFILPLIVIFILSLVGFSSQKFNVFLKKHLGTIKIILAFIFLLLGLLVIWDEVKFSLQFYLALP
jgi:cytochrome c biogenesis protein CcdA